MDVTIGDLVEEVRREVDEITLPGEKVADDADLEDMASSNFSDAALKDRLMDATRFIVARVQARYIPEFITTVTPSDLSSPYDGTGPKILRLIGTTVTAENSDGDPVEAYRRTMDAYQNLSEIRVNESYPTFVFEGYELIIDNGSDMSVKEAKVVRVPDNKYGDVTALPSTFRGALVEHTSAGCFETLRMGSRANGARKRLAQEIGHYRVRFGSINEEEDG